jgi:hypothetical protein
MAVSELIMNDADKYNLNIISADYSDTHIDQILTSVIGLFHNLP